MWQGVEIYLAKCSAPPSSWCICLPCHLQLFLLLIRAKVRETRGFKCSEVAQPFISLAEQFPSPLLLPLLLPESSQEKKVGCQGLPDHLQGLWGGGRAGLSHEFLLSLAISRFAELDVRLSVAVPDRDLPSHWALEQVCTHGPLP